MRFYVPPTLQKDFSASLNTLGTDAIVNFDTSKVIKVRLDKVNYKTKNGQVSSDEVVFAELDSNLKMGDYLQYKNETMLITQLKSNEFPKCFEFTTTTCNVKFDITRFQKEQYDGDGNIITPEGDSPVINDLYCSTLFSNFEFKTNTGSVGVVPMDQVVVSCQYNDTTKNIAIGDKFIWFGSAYIIVSLDYSQVDISGKTGLLTFYGKKVV